MDIWGKHTAGRRHGKDIGAKLREYLVCSRSNRKAGMAGVWSGRTAVGDAIEEAVAEVDYKGVWIPGY